MGRDDQPKQRQAARDLRRRAARRQPAERVLIVCEGAKTEPLYLNEIRQQLRLPSANVQALPAGDGTEPLRIVEYAEVIFTRGRRELGIHARSFDRVAAVFDRDEHRTYHDALAKAAALNQRLVNDHKVKVPFEAVASVPCFELWLLLHFEDVRAPLRRNDALQRLRAHLPGYAKARARTGPRRTGGSKRLLAVRRRWPTQDTRHPTGCSRTPRCTRWWRACWA